ncbi:MAG: GNAT family N-acetyltransferase [Paracoccaceae bacterium]|jgi:GNAT superfamily N-acetyltransferase
MNNAPLIRVVKPIDRPEWDVLYQGYADFYKATQTTQMRDQVWSWLLDPAVSSQGLVALNGRGRLVGLAHYRAFARPLSATMGGFLDDLFVDPAARGARVGDALIAALSEIALARGWSVLRWITADDNARARSLYDRVATQTKWVTYDIKI